MLLGTPVVVNPTPFITFGQRVVDGSDLAQMAFADGRMFWSYQAANLLHFGLIALLGGLLLWQLSRRRSVTLSPPHLVTLSLLVLLFLDLWLAHGRFNPAADVALSPLAEGGVPPVVRFINEREGDGAENCQLSMVNCQSSIEEPWRFTTFDMPGDKTFNANVGMYYGWQDIRGYDSIIPRQYADFMQRVAPQENELLYNRIAPLYSNVTGDPYAILNNPLLNLLNVKYLLTEHYVPNPKWQEIYRDEAIGVYENQDVMPRVFLVPEARVLAVEEQPLTETESARRGLHRGSAGRCQCAGTGQSSGGRCAHQPLYRQRCLCRCQPERPRLAGPHRRLFPRLEGLHPPLWL